MTKHDIELELLRQRSQSKASVKNLTKREIAAIAYLDPKLTLEQVAASLFITRNTLKSQLRNAFRKLGVNCQEQAIAWAHKTVGEDQ